MSEEQLDREFVERCLRGDLDAFSMLIDRYQAPVFRIVLNMVGNYEDAKEVLQQVYRWTHDPFFQGRVAFLEDYDMHLATSLVQGVDLWMNLPRVPLEACGTSGMKAALNAIPQLGTIDGWWEEGYDGSNGWAVPLPPDASSPESADAHDAAGEPARHLGREVPTVEAAEVVLDTGLDDGESDVVGALRRRLDGAHHDAHRTTIQPDGVGERELQRADARDGDGRPVRYPGLHPVMVVQTEQDPRDAEGPDADRELALRGERAARDDALLVGLIPHREDRLGADHHVDVGQGQLDLGLDVVPEERRERLLPAHREHAAHLDPLNRQLGECKLHRAFSFRASASRGCRGR